MKKRSVGFAMTILIIGNLVAVLSDALIKTMGKDAAIFQFVFFRQLSAVIILLPFCLTATKQSFLIGLKWHFVRAHGVWLLGAVFMVISLSTLPLATANAIFYAPLDHASAGNDYYMVKNSAVILLLLVLLALLAC